MRRYSPIAKSRGTVIPPEVRRKVLARDHGQCVCYWAGFPLEIVEACPLQPVELDHIRASHGMGMKSETTARNLVSLSNPCHLWKTLNGRKARPLLLDYIEREGNPHDSHVDPCPECPVRVTA